MPPWARWSNPAATLRCVRAANLAAGDRLLILGPGPSACWSPSSPWPIRSRYVLGLTPPSLAFARTLGVAGTWTAADLPTLPFDAVVDASTGPDLPALALDLVEPGKRIVYIGLSATPSRIDTGSSS